MRLTSDFIRLNFNISSIMHCFFSNNVAKSRYLGTENFIQGSRTLRISSPLGKDVLLPEAVNINEAVNVLFEIEIFVRSKQQIPPSEMIGKLVDLELKVSATEKEETYRPFNGLVIALKSQPKISRDFRHYVFTLRPQLWLLSQRTDHRIWMDQTATDVLQNLLREHGLPGPDLSGIVGELPRFHYSVQHGESDLAYVLRRMEEVGLFWWFSHEKGQHKLHVANHSSGWLQPSQATKGNARVSIAFGSADKNHIKSWQQHFTYIPGAWSGSDWNFETPKTNIQAETSSLVSLQGNADKKVFEYPARSSTSDEVERTGKLRMQAIEAGYESIQGASDVRILEAGRRFQPYEVANYAEIYEECVVTRIEHRIAAATYETTDQNPEYQNKFHAVPSRVPLTSGRKTPLPRVEGTQIAIVAGPSSEEIHTDKYGRVKLYFPWDRRAKKDGSDTCWVRVCQLWGGGTWGAQIIPRVGMEVVVAFEGGDPDRPMVVGALSNPDNMPAYKLPDNKTRMVLRSNTHKGTGFNEMSFEDLAGKENQFFHAQKDRTERILNNSTKRIDASEVTSIGVNRAVEVGGNEKHEIGGSLNVTVGGVGDDAKKQVTKVASLAGQTAELLRQADQIAGGSSGVGAFSSSIYSSSLGFFDGNALQSREGVVAGSNPRSDAGAALASSGDKVGQAAGALFPQAGVMNTIVGAFKSDTIGTASVEQVGVSKVSNVGKASIEKIGKSKKIIVGEELIIEVGASKIVMKSNGDISITGKKFNFEASGSVQLSGKKIDLN